MAKISEQFSNAFIRSEDFDAKGKVFTISGCEEEEVGKGEAKLVLHFEDYDLGMPLNKTNALALAEFLGDETNGWRGKQVEIYRDFTMFNGKRTACLRVRAPRGSGSGSR